ncbi:MAG: adenylosuccinate lyase [Candidatus Ratteibacteria bacterium]|nr:adenylosuccinate lyase [Candidatus Ratteibacteria bacterium]
MIERYTRPEMAKIWLPEYRFQKMLEIELLACEAMAELGQIPKEALKTIKSKARFDPKRINEIEVEVKHELLAFLANLAEKIGPEAKFIHHGLTSNDILDTTLSLQMKDAAEIILTGLKELSNAVRKKAKAHKKTVMVGRTHGIHAEPITLGFKLTLWLAELERSQKRIEEAKEVISYGKLSGAVGTYALVNPYIEEYVCRKLNLKPAPISNQILQRDRQAQFMAVLAILGGSLEKFATEIRNLQRTEIHELEEPFTRGQKGSSAMPHKRNPVSCEQICGLARLLRSYAQASFENITLWNERDISHSSVERVIIPDGTILIDYMLKLFQFIVENLMVYPEKMEENLKATRGLIFSGRILLELTKKGLTRQEAYRLVQNVAMQVGRTEEDFKTLLLKDKVIRKYLNETEITTSFNLDVYLRNLPGIFKKFKI